MIYVVGSVNLDYVARLQALPRPGETVLGGVLEKTPGGKGANQALAARRAGAPVCLIACVGEDEDARVATALLTHDGVDLSAAQQADLPTGVALIQIDAAGENAITVLPGANMRLTAPWVEARLAGLTSGDLVLLQQEIPQATTRAALAAARAAGATSILNAAPILPDSGDLAEEADIVIVNETEFERITGRAPGKAEAEAWCRRTGRRLALTLGAGGAILAGAGETLHLRPQKIEPVDTVGAGDTFAGYLAAGLHAGRTAHEALGAAVAAASLACLSQGAQAAMPKADAVETVIRSLRA